MSFLLVPSRLHTPLIPNFSYHDDITYRGYEADTGKFAFFTSYGYIISEQFAYSLNFGGIIYRPVFTNINGSIYWKNNDDYIYYSINHSGWVKSNRFPGYEPYEYYDSDDQQYKGDSFWVGDIPTQSGSSTFYPRGSIRNSGSNVTVSQYWKRWQSSNRLGKYSPQDDASGDLYFGVPRWKDNDGMYYVRSIRKKAGIYSYDGIIYNGQKWIIGTVNDPSGWWEGDEPPSMSESRIFLFTVPAGSEIVGRNKVVSFCDYVLGNERFEVCLAEVAIWR